MYIDIFSLNKHFFYYLIIPSSHDSESFTKPSQNEGFGKSSFTSKKKDEGRRQKQKVSESLDGIEYCVGGRKKWHIEKKRVV
ncbi:hypothetical protein TNCV_271741 [Trichonephila clavipes]|nr:hypothetical protein TNCV_271741 [Trichonephila clavipes]